ncbi:hypothetical protein RA19_11135 [Leisingera sp. ANG-M1]|uniref:hypothetical protein n=1 Tax=Leisingera sp. ANG-M1 TaxID=1577895 RepID=UPI00057CAE29|nr:hypothetical protein [Leisingera sp. ANG-M1]KIC10270.1 hypothetical protein RA19_11135 [Leisingera sp. ANG-M1]
MKAWSIFAHSLGMVIRNIKEAVQIALVPAAIAFGVLLALGATAGLSFSAFSDQAAMEQMLVENSGSFAGGILVFWLLIMVTMLWIVVSWHRFVLLEEYPSGWVPAFRFDRMLSYFGHGLLMLLVAFAIMVPIMLLIMTVSAVAPAVSIIVMVVAYLALLVAMYRLVPVLPAAAIGKPLKLTEAWNATAGANGTIIALFLIMVAFQILIQLAAAVVLMIPVIGAIIVFAAMLILSLVSASVLTTFYGHYVEGRPI